MQELRLNETPECRELRSLLAGRTGTCPEDWFLTFRARESMQTVFEEICRHSGVGDVIIQPFTCSTVPESVLAGGLDIKYSDISADNLSLDPDVMSPDSSTRAVVIQHTFGMIDSISAQAAAEKAHKAGALVLEDCAQCVCRMARKPSGEPAADISVHSFGLEKMINSHFGGAVWVDPDMADKVLREAIVSRLASLPAVDQRVERSVASYRTRIRVLNHLPMKIRRPVRKHWTVRRRFIPGISPEELDGGILLDPSVPGAGTVRRVIRALEDIDQNEAVRSEAVKYYSRFFRSSDSSVTVPGFALSTDQPLLWFPVNAGSTETAQKLTDMLNRSGYYSSTWGRPLLFPGVTDPEVFRYEEAASCSVAAAVSDGIVLLPTKQEMPDIEKIAEIIDTGSQFVPVLLGTETNAYNMARAFHEAYGIRSYAFGRYPLSDTANSAFVEVHCDPEFTDPDRFVSILNEAASMFGGRKAILLSCGDSYTRLLSLNKDRLDPAYIPVCPDYEAVDSVNSKVRFYSFCEKAGIPYPKTVVIHDSSIPELPFGYPLVLKPDDADDYNAHPFEGQKKAFILDTRDELESAAKSTYDAGYTGAMLIQEFIPGGDDNMRVVNGYIRTDGTPALLSTGRPLLEDYYPMAIGNYTVILASGNDEVYDTIEKLVASVPYFGYFNVDLKYDRRDGVYKVFDFNPRMGRSSYYVTLAGHNLAKCVAEDVVFHTGKGTARSYDEVLWADVPVSIIRKYIRDKEMRARALQLIRSGKYGGTFRKAGEKHPKRRIHDLKLDARSIRNYHKYYKEKDGE